MKRLLELYNAIEGTSYKDPNIININTLEGVLFANRQNDISSGNPLKEAIEKAVLYCIDKGILRDYLKQNSSEIVNMFNIEFNLKDALAVRYEEGIEEGIARGEAKGMKKLLTLLEKGIPLAEAKRRLEISKNYVR